MKRLLLSPLLLFLILCSSNKESVLADTDNPIVNLKCTLNELFYYDEDTDFLEYNYSFSEEDYNSGPIFISFNKETFGSVTVNHKRFLGGRYGNRVDYNFKDYFTIKTTKDLIRFKHTRFKDTSFSSDYIYEINRTNGKIAFIQSNVGKKTIKKGQCEVIENKKPLF